MCPRSNMENLLFWALWHGKYDFLGLKNTYLDLVIREKYQVIGLSKKAHFPNSEAPKQISGVRESRGRSCFRENGGRRRRGWTR